MWYPQQREWPVALAGRTDHLSAQARKGLSDSSHKEICSPSSMDSGWFGANPQPAEARFPKIGIPFAENLI